MPLVRISLRKGRPVGFGKRIGTVVYQTMVDKIYVPSHDNFQVISEHDPESLIYDPEYLGIPRTDDVVFIQITLNEGRTIEMKKVFFKTLAERLSQELDLRPEDIFSTWWKSRTRTGHSGTVLRNMQHKRGFQVQFFSFVF